MNPEAFAGAPSGQRTAMPSPITGSSPVAATMHVTPGAMQQMPHPTGPHRTGPGGSGPVVVGPSGPMGTASMPSGGHHQLPAAQTGGLYDSSASVVHAPKKSKTGLIIAIIAVLAVGGGVAAFVIVSSDKKSGSGSQVASGSDPGSDKIPDKGSDVAVKVPDKGSNETPTVDAGVAAAVDAAEVATVDASTPATSPT